MFVFVIIVVEKFMIIENRLSDTYNRLGTLYNNGNKQIKQEIPPLTKKQKDVIILSSAAGMAPVIAVLATQAKGTTIIKDAQDLRNKEADRITAVKTELRKIGANIEETPDGLVIKGKTDLAGNCEIECYHDHRIAMSAYVAGLICKKPIKINEFQWVDISFPEFLSLMNKISTY